MEEVQTDIDDYLGEQWSDLLLMSMNRLMNMLSLGAEKIHHDKIEKAIEEVEYRSEKYKNYLRRKYEVQERTS
jgi:hypothetical protein